MLLYISKDFNSGWPVYVAHVVWAFRKGLNKTFFFFFLWLVWERRRPLDHLCLFTNQLFECLT